MSQSRIGRRAFLQGASLAALGASEIVDALPSLAQDAVPNSTGTERPKLKAPALACDCHHHIYDPRFPATAPPVGGGKPEPNATVADYRLLQRRIGTKRNVILTPGPYMTDNSVTLDAIAQFGPSARGVAIIRPDITDAELKKLHDGGIRGIRFVYPHPGGLTTMDMIEPLSKRVHELGWHVDINLAPAAIAENEDLWNRLPTMIVFDHLAHVVPPAGVDSPGFMTIRRLMDKGKAWMKLSIYVADSKDGAPTYADLTAAAKAYVQAAPERVVWGSNWPHPGENPKPDDALFLDMLLQWAPDKKTRHRILVENPETLFGFPKSA